MRCDYWPIPFPAIVYNIKYHHTYNRVLRGCNLTAGIWKRCIRCNIVQIYTDGIDNDPIAFIFSSRGLAQTHAAGRNPLVLGLATCGRLLSGCEKRSWFASRCYRRYDLTTQHIHTVNHNTNCVCHYVFVLLVLSFQTQAQHIPRIYLTIICFTVTMSIA